jgi:hypothetical protein
MVDFSCAIKLSTPIAIMSAMREASNLGAVVKGGKYLEALANADVVVFDKTGTLTTATPTVERIITFNGMSDCVKLLGECENITFKNSTVRASANVLQLGEAKVKTDVKGLYVRNIDVSFCDSFFEFLNGSANLVSAENIKVRISFSFAKLFDIFDLEDSEFENIKAYLIDRGLNADKTKCYFSFASCPDGLEIRNFERVSDMESIPFAPTFIMKNTNADTGKLLIDGMALDNVIAARGKSKTVAMTTAKLANPCNKFIYTLEVGVSKDDSFTLPLGGFDYMSINRR